MVLHPYNLATVKSPVDLGISVDGAMELNKSLPSSEENPARTSEDKTCGAFRRAAQTKLYSKRWSLMALKLRSGIMPLGIFTTSISRLHSSPACKKMRDNTTKVRKLTVPKSILHM